MKKKLGCTLGIGLMALAACAKSGTAPSPAASTPPANCTADFMKAETKDLKEIQSSELPVGEYKLNSVHYLVEATVDGATTRVNFVHPAAAENGTVACQEGKSLRIRTSNEIPHAMAILGETFEKPEQDHSIRFEANVTSKSASSKSGTYRMSGSSAQLAEFVANGNVIDTIDHYFEKSDGVFVRTSERDESGIHSMLVGEYRFVPFNTNIKLPALKIKMPIQTNPSFAERRLSRILDRGGYMTRRHLMTLVLRGHGEVETYIGKLMNLSSGTKAADHHELKKETEHQIGNLRYNRSASSMKRVLDEQRLQCSSGTLLMVAAWMSAADHGSEFGTGEKVLIFRPGHILPGYVTQTPSGYELHGIEMTAGGRAHIAFGAISKLDSRTRIIPLNEGLIIQATADTSSNALEVAANLASETAKRFGQTRTAPLAMSQAQLNTWRQQTPRALNVWVFGVPSKNGLEVIDPANEPDVERVEQDEIKPSDLDAMTGAPGPTEAIEPAGVDALKATTSLSGSSTPVMMLGLGIINEPTFISMKADPKVASAELIQLFQTNLRREPDRQELRNWAEAVQQIPTSNDFNNYFQSFVEFERLNEKGSGEEHQKAEPLIYSPAPTPTAGPTTLSISEEVWQNHQDKNVSEKAVASLYRHATGKELANDILVEIATLFRKSKSKEDFLSFFNEFVHDPADPRTHLNRLTH